MLISLGKLAKRVGLPVRNQNAISVIKKNKNEESIAIMMEGLLICLSWKYLIEMDLYFLMEDCSLWYQRYRRHTFTMIYRNM